MGSSITAAVVEESGLSDQTECLRTESGTGRAYAHGTRTGRLRQVVDVPGEYPLLWSTTNACSGRTARKAKVVELRFFGGLSVEETADVLRVSSITVMREWKSAKAWLYRELAGPTANGH
ncbi:MAG: hypothetical protein DMF87_14215 [Acidobacteria bacterium]|nr:MAG: hypothetical protein DMF87_14215 [Acidobacteriota bacterium]